MAEGAMRVPVPQPQHSRRANTDGTHEIELPAIVFDVLHSPGRRLDAATRAFFEPRFGHDFGRIRVHTGPEAAEAARGVNALAFAAGSHLVFRDERDAMVSGDRRLLAHELAHVVQQESGSDFTGPGRTRGQENLSAGMLSRRVDPRVRDVPERNPRSCAVTMHEYLLHLQASQNRPGGSIRLPMNPYVVPSIQNVLTQVSLSCEFAERVAWAYRDIYYRDLLDDIVTMAGDEQDHLMHLFFTGGPGDFPESPEDTAVV